jgi:ketosteroid isomerase-like protein
MSQETVEVVRKLYTEHERGNFAIQELLDPNIRVRWPDIAGGRAESVGLDDATETMLGWLRTFESVTLAAERIIDAGDQVVSIAVWRARGKASGVDTEWRIGAVFTVRQGKVVSIVSYTDPDDALEAAGLRE